MRIEFKTITIKNFKGVLGERKITFNPTLTQILGANHAGKTTIVDAVRWVLFDKNSEGAQVFGIDPKDENGQVIHHLDNTVMLELTADGKDYKLEKVRTEIWSKPRKQEEAVMTGHTTKFFVNEDKYTAKDYKSFVDSLCNEELFKVLTMPSYFPTLPAESQRRLLIKMVGNTNEDDIAGDNEDFKSLLTTLAGTDIQKYREQLRYKISELKKEIDEIPSRINENAEELQVLETSKPNFDFIRKRIKEIETGIENIDNELTDLSRTVDSEFNERTKERTEINKLKNRMQAIVQSYQDKNTTEERKHKQAIDDAKYDIEVTDRAIRNAKAAIEDGQAELNKIAITSDDFKKRWMILDQTTFSWDNNQEVCPTCHQRLPQEDIDKMKEELEGNFNDNKSKQFDALEAEAARIKKRKSEAEATIKKSKDKLEKLEKQRKEQEEKLQKVQEAKPALTYPTEDEEYQQLQMDVNARTAALEARTEEETSDSKVNQEASLKQRKAEQNRLRDELRDELAKEQRITDKQNRINELEDRQKNLNQQLTDLEKQDYTAEQFIIAKITDLETKVNKLFTNVQFKMFEPYITTGGIKTTCECTMHGTPYRDLSNSEKINAGIDIINATCRYNDIYAPLLIDNAESITDILPTRSQQILLIVSRDKELTIIQ
jgi:DNA repair exonuclease SbcCD ATPase subunit